MDFAWTKEQLDLRDSLRKFGAERLTSNVIERDREGVFSREDWNRCAEHGVLGLCVPEEWGGSGLDILTTIFAMEGLGYGCTDNGLLFALNAQMWSVQVPLLRFGTDDQKNRYLKRLLNGEIIGAHCMTEPGSGSDSYALSTAAARDPKGYRLTGSKTFISNAATAEVFLVFATINPKMGFLGVTAFLVDRDTGGLEVGAPIPKMGLKTAPMCEVFFDNCLVSEANRLGAEGNGGTIFKHSMLWERSCILASSLGMLQRQLERTIDYAKTRQQFGQPLSANQAISHRIVDMYARLETARLLLYHAGWLRGEGKNAQAEVALAKLQLSESLVQSSLDAVQIHGGYGYATEYEFERDLRDSVGSRIYSGTSEIQRNIIARSLGL